MDLEDSCTDFLLPMRSWCTRMHYIYTPNFLPALYYVALWLQKYGHFTIFIDFGIFVVSPVVGDLRKLITGAQLQTFPYI